MLLEYVFCARFCGLALAQSTITDPSLSGLQPY